MSEEEVCFLDLKHIRVGVSITPPEELTRDGVVFTIHPPDMIFNRPVVRFGYTPCSITTKEVWNGNVDLFHDHRFDDYEYEFGRECTTKEVVQRLEESSNPQTLTINLKICCHAHYFACKGTDVIFYNTSLPEKAGRFRSCYFTLSEYYLDCLKKAMEFGDVRRAEIEKGVQTKEEEAVKIDAFTQIEDLSEVVEEVDNAELEKSKIGDEGNDQNKERLEHDSNTSTDNPGDGNEVISNELVINAVVIDNGDEKNCGRNGLTRNDDEDAFANESTENINAEGDKSDETRENGMKNRKQGIMPDIQFVEENEDEENNNLNKSKNDGIRDNFDKLINGVEGVLRGFNIGESGAKNHFDSSDYNKRVEIHFSLSNGLLFLIAFLALLIAAMGMMLMLLTLG